MADENKECPCSWMDKAKAICLVIGAVTTSAASIAAAIFGVLNHNSNAVQVQRSEEVRDTLEAQTAKTDAKLGSIERTAMKTAATVEDTAGVQLYNTWKNLEWLAYESGKPEDVKKAAEAKLVFEEFRAKQGKKP